MIEKLLHNAITQYKLELANINHNIDFLKKSTEPVKADLQAAILELQKICEHPSSHRVDGPYYPAGFDYYSESSYTIVCDSCGKVLESKCIRGNHFG